MDEGGSQRTALTAADLRFCTAVCCLQYEYPDQYQAEDKAPMGDDANLLAHEEVEVQRRQRSRPGRGTAPGDGRSFASAEA